MIKQIKFPNNIKTSYQSYLYPIFLMGTLALIFLGQIVTTVNTSAPNFQVSATRTIDGADNKLISFDVSISSARQGTHKKIAIIPIAQTNDWQQITVFYDENYPMIFGNKEGVFGLVDHLKTRTKLYGLQSNITLVDANQLQDKVKKENENIPNSKQIIILPAGGIPDLLYSPQSGWSSISEWVNNGGTIFWLGEKMGHYLLKPKRNAINIVEIDQSMANTLIDSRYFFPYQLPDQTYRLSSQTDSAFSQTLNLRYPYLFRSPMASSLSNPQEKSVKDLTTLPDHDSKVLPGAVLGKILDTGSEEYKRTSIALIRHGLGSYVIFGSGILEIEEIVGDDIAKILASSILDATNVNHIKHQDLPTNIKETNLRFTDIIIPKEAIGFAIMYIEDYDTSTRIIKHLIPLP
ncbi:MAG: hypothetical protein BWY68_00105 [bacterium ADurb.Bin400]|nr:MAG: hypothetical protein BWY68_00105 [bacterium ADurb.Bin400]